MNTTDEIEISQSEWETMRVVWTLKEATSHQIIQILEDKLGWKASTTKTYLGRLVKKGALQTNKVGREFTYYPAIDEQEAMDHATSTLFGHLCQHKVGSTLATLIQQMELSKDDLKMLEQVVGQKALTAPAKVSCNCLSKDCDMNCHTNTEETC